LDEAAIVTHIHDRGATLPMVSFEIGNEVDVSFGKNRTSSGAIAPYQGSGSAYTSGRYVDSTEGPPIFHYEDVFAAAAHGLNDALGHDHYRAYRIVTAGMIGPTANLGHGPNTKPYCTGALNQNEPPAAGAFMPQDNTANVFMAGQSINKARGGGRYQPTATGPFVSSPAVATGHLAVAVHPYGYDTQAQTQWRNFYATRNNKGQPYGWAGPCLDLGDMYRAWTHGARIRSRRAASPAPPGTAPATMGSRTISPSCRSSSPSTTTSRAIRMQAGTNSAIQSRRARASPTCSPGSTTTAA